MYKNSVLRILRKWRKHGKRANLSGGENINPELKLAKESAQFLNIFPELVWKCIARHLDCNDFYNLINSSPFFRNLLKETRIQRLFKNLFEIILSTRFIQGKEVMALIFNCRLVCREWNNSLSNLVEKYFLKNMSDTQNQGNKLIFHYFLKKYQFRNFEKIEKFKEKFGKHKSNPFFGKSIFLFVPPICHPDTSSNQHFYDKALFLLDLFGRYVYNCEIHLSSEEHSYTIDSEQTYLNLMDLLWAMLNLRNLRIFQFSKILLPYSENMRVCPTLRKLESLELHSVSRTICDAMLQKNLQVSRLFIHQSYEIDRRAGYLTYPFEHLEHVQLKYYNWSEICYLRDNNIIWKLKTLKLEFYVNDDGKDFYRVNCSTVWADIFNVLSKRFGETLEDLRLELPEMTNDLNRTMVAECMLHYRLNFPKLKKIDLIVGNYSPVDFLLGIAETLEILTITFSLSDHNAIKNSLHLKRQDAVRIYSCFCERCLSKLWKLFPKLKTVQMRDSEILKFNRQEL